MIENNGWIFPSGEEIDLEKEGIWWHQLVITRFISGLKSQNPQAYEIINKEMEELGEKPGSRAIIEFAITRLGWIKVGAAAWHEVSYAGYDWQSDLVREYEEDGWSLKSLHFPSKDYLNINCKYYLRIVRGRR